MWFNVINVLKELLAVFYLLNDKGVIYIPKPKPGWIGSIADGLALKLLYEQVGYNGTDGRTHGCAMYLYIILTLEEEVGIFFRKNSSNVVMCCMDVEVLLWSFGSCCSLCLMMEMAGSTGTDVKRVFISNDEIQSLLF